MAAVIGIDAGSTAVKGALWDGEEFITYLVPTGWNPAESAAKAVTMLKRRAGRSRSANAAIVTTGYGRMIVDADKRVTEITCHAAGAHYLVPEASTVLDIGGQDSKVISVMYDGKVADFLMNDKCAAGTGRFLQNMAVHLGGSLTDFCDIPANTELQPINSMCAVFAESEVIGLIAKGVSKDSISLGLLDSIAQRAANLVSKLSEYGDICFTGGCAQNPLLAELIAKKTGRRVIAPERAQFAGAIGAALIGAGVQL